jgi:hypothetical protein
MTQHVRYTELRKINWHEQVAPCSIALGWLLRESKGITGALAASFLVNPNLPAVRSCFRANPGHSFFLPRQYKRPPQWNPSPIPSSFPSRLAQSLSYLSPPIPSLTLLPNIPNPSRHPWWTPWWERRRRAGGQDDDGRRRQRSRRRFLEVFLLESPTYRTS